MFQVRFHGRGGQGVVSAAEILSLAAFREGKYAQAFPSFGSERMGAPVMAFCRIDDRVIRLREPVMKPDCLIIQDATLLHQAGLFDGLSKNGYILLNSKHEFGSLNMDALLAKYPEDRRITVPATELAMEYVKRPVPNAALLGAFAALTSVVTLESVLLAIKDKFPGQIGEANSAAASKAYTNAKLALEAPHATAN
jgi:pyruvate ferredoxin oxidoreductase gamma subunit